MDTRTGHVVRDIAQVEADQRAQYTEIQDAALAKYADELLAGTDEAFANLKGDDPLAKFARETRQLRRRANRAKGKRPRP